MFLIHSERKIAFSTGFQFLLRRVLTTFIGPPTLISTLVTTITPKPQKEPQKTQTSNLPYTHILPHQEET
jgi:hypothetical protein